MGCIAYTVKHTGVVAPFGVGWPPHSSFLAMELVEGGSLADALGRPWPIRKALQLIEALADTVCVLHQNGLVHGQIDPTHIMLTPTGQPKLTGFRQSRHFEQRADAGFNADIDGLGAVLYRLLTGQTPSAPDAPVWPAKMDHRVPVELKTLCMKCLTNQPKDRYPSARALADDLREYLQKSESRPLRFIKRFWHRLFGRPA